MAAERLRLPSQRSPGPRSGSPGAARISGDDSSPPGYRLVLVSRIVDVVVPERLGNRFRWVLASSWTSNLGDGILIAAGPLLVASRTDDAFLVALAALLQWLPPLLFGLWAGAMTDRLDRRRLVIAVDSVRAVVVAVLAAAVATDRASIALILVALFLMGTAETFADNASSTMVPMLVHRDDLALANSRITGGFVTVNQLVGPPLGALLFAAGHALPFAADAVLVAGGALLISRISLPPHLERAPRDPRPARHRRGCPLGRAPRRRPDAGAHDPHLQRHVRCRVVGARPVRA